MTAAETGVAIRYATVDLRIPMAENPSDLEETEAKFFEVSTRISGRRPRADFFELDGETDSEFERELGDRVPTMRGQG